MKNIAPGVLYLDRADWGARTDIVRLGGPEMGTPGQYRLVYRNERTEAIYHHSVGIDNDTTPDAWETLDEVKSHMRHLQVIRPDLGLDVPYNFVMFLMADAAHTIVVCEGRGYDRSGAHTGCHNITGIATCVEGDFENYAIDITPWLPAINGWNGHLGAEFPLLGTVHPAGPAARDFFGHRDFAADCKPLNQTACPGQHWYKRLAEFRLDGAPQALEDDDMNPACWVRDTANGKSYVIVGGRKRHVENAAQEKAYLKAGYIKLPDVAMTTAELATIPDA